MLTGKGAPPQDGAQRFPLERHGRPSAEPGLPAGFDAFIAGEIELDEMMPRVKAILGIK
ncbi:hypothetical protein I6F11_26775 [Ensifer sp. NBAIM29]|nr:hypothetical protein [Ensifer sp. NBAIM29]